MKIVALEGYIFFSVATRLYLMGIDMREWSLVHIQSGEEFL